MQTVPLHLECNGTLCYCIQIRCDKTCLVMQVNKNWNDDAGIFQTHVTPTSAYNKYVVAATPELVDTNTIHFIRLFTNATDTSGILINGLEHTDWNCFNGLYDRICEANIRVSGPHPQSFNIFSENDFFGGYLIAQNTLAEGYAQSLGYNGKNVI